MSFAMVIAECPDCGQRYHGWSEEEARDKYKNHRCMSTRMEKEISEILERVINE